MPSSAVETPKIIEEALMRFNLVVDAESELREKCLDDLKFSIGDQWPTTIKGQREKDGRPCLTLDKMQQSTRLVCNEYRQQRPAIQVNPIGDGADTDTAEIYQGLVRHIEVNSDAEIAYDGAHEFVVRIGFGSWRILSDYTDDDSDEQEIFIRKIRNPFTVYWQPGVEQEDAEWCFITADIPRETYRTNYPDSIASADAFTSTGAMQADWITEDYIRVAEYFTVKKEKGKKGRKDKKIIEWHLINAIEELEEAKEVPGTQIPVFTAYGDDLDINGDRYVAGLIRNGKDPQRMNNYWNSAATEAIALAPKAPWIVIAGQLQGFETSWEQSNVKNTAVLTYNPVDVQGKPAPPPQRNAAEPPIQAMAHMLEQSALDLKSALGLYDPSLGQKKGNESGAAIGKLQQQGDVATLNYSDNMARAMRRCGRVLLQWIRRIYDTPRVARIINPDGTVNQVIIHNGPSQAEAAQKLQTEKIQKIYDIGVGRYDVAIAVGPSYQSKRQQAVATQLELLKMLPPELVTSFADLVIRNMDIPQAKELADRAKKLLPPQLQDDDTDPQSQIAKLQAQLQQMGQQGQVLSQKLQEATQIIQTKQVEHQAKTEQVLIQEQNAFGIAKLKADTEIAVAEINTKAQQLQERISSLQELHSDLHEAAHEKAMADEQHAHEQSLASQQQGADAASQGADIASKQQTQASDQAHQQTMAQQAAETQGADNAGNS